MAQLGTMLKPVLADLSSLEKLFHACKEFPWLGSCQKKSNEKIIIRIRIIIIHIRKRHISDSRSRSREWTKRKMRIMTHIEGHKH